MGEPELKIALQRDGEARIRGFWQDAEGSVEQQRAETKQELDLLREETDRVLQSEAARLRNNLLFEAQTRAMECRLHAESALEKRLLVLAGTLLPELVPKSRAELWLALCKELPVAEWTTITVHPDDHDLAAKAYPSADIACNAEISGGLIAANRDNSIRVDNTLGCRLTRLWPDLLPEILANLRQQVNNDEAAGTDTTG